MQKVDPDQRPHSAPSRYKWLNFNLLTVQLQTTFNSFTATGDNNRLLQTAEIQMRRLNEPSHLDLRYLTFSLSILHVNTNAVSYLAPKELNI